MECKHSPNGSYDLAFSADGHLIIYTNIAIGETKIWRGVPQELLFHSKYTSACRQGLSESEAATAVRGCGPKSICMCLRSMGRVSGDVFLDHDGVHFVPANDSSDGRRWESKLLAVHPDGGMRRWEYSPLQGTLVTIAKDRLLLCRLVLKNPGSFLETKYCLS